MTLIHSSLQHANEDLACACCNREDLLLLTAVLYSMYYTQRTIHRDITCFDTQCHVVLSQTVDAGGGARGSHLNFPLPGWGLQKNWSHLAFRYKSCITFGNFPKDWPGCIMYLLFIVKHQFVCSSDEGKRPSELRVVSWEVAVGVAEAVAKGTCVSVMRNVDKITVMIMRKPGTPFVIMMKWRMDK